MVRGVRLGRKDEVRVKEYGRLGGDVVGDACHSDEEKVREGITNTGRLRHRQGKVPWLGRAQYCGEGAYSKAGEVRAAAGLDQGL